MSIHPTAIVDKTAQIGSNVEIGAFTLVGANVTISDNTRIANNVTIKNNTRIGKDCHIFQGSVLGEVPQDLKFGGEDTYLEIGDRTTVREFCTLNRGTSELGKTSIGSDILLMAYVHVAHDCIIKDKVILANGVQLGGHVKIGYHSAVGGMTPVHQFCNIGEHAFVGGGFRVVQDIPPYILASGEPLLYTGLNIVGLRRRGFSQNTRTLIKRAYRLIFKSNLNRTEAISKIRSEFEITGEIRTIVDFIENSERGII
jgi:UDP-N-acetylglucosamine acyltransferase